MSTKTGREVKMNLYYLSITMTVIANLSYHLCMKSTRPDVNPMASLAITYLAAMTTSLICAPFFAEGMTLKAFSAVGWPSLILGPSICLLELGFLLAYRAGWNMSSAALYCNLVVAMALLPIGTIVFRETVRPINFVGIVLALVALVLVGIR